MDLTQTTEDISTIGKLRDVAIKEYGKTGHRVGWLRITPSQLDTLRRNFGDGKPLRVGSNQGIVSSVYISEENMEQIIKRVVEIRELIIAF